jgi:acetyl-CoA C-acetyltransferase/acetyl-CoA acyltransferase
MFGSAEQPPILLDYVRTPFCKMDTALADVGAVELGRTVVSELAQRLPVSPDAVDEVIMGNAGQPHDAANIARVIAVEANLPEHVPAYTVQRNCASGMEAVGAAARKVRTGEADLIIAGGTESMSQYPLLFPEKAQKKFKRMSRSKSTWETVCAVTDFRPGDFSPVVALESGLTDPTCDLNMGETAEVLAREWDISRQEQDEYALRSHQRTTAAWEEGRLEEEVIPVFTPPDYEEVIEQDNIFRPEQSLDALSKLDPVFDPETGTITPGNSSPLTDGAAATIVASPDLVNEWKREPLGEILNYQTAGLDPKRMGLGPAYATSKLLDETGTALSDFDLIEMNEAFSAQMIANFQAFRDEEFARQELGHDEPLGEIDHEILNVNGGAISIGHPIGTTGTRLVGTILKELDRRDDDLGLSTLCVGGGQGAAMALRSL